MTSAMIPDLIKPILAAHASGDRKQAAALYARVLPIINYENRQCGLRSAKAVMVEGGVIKSDAVRHPLTPLHPETRKGLLELARETGQPAADPVRLIVPMLERFIATDRGFTKARRSVLSPKSQV